MPDNDGSQVVLTMKESEVVSEVINLYRACEYYRRKYVEKCAGAQSDYDMYVMTAGRNAVIMRSMLFNTSVKTEEGKAESYEEWLKRAVLSIPDCFSWDGFVRYFNDELRDIYGEEAHRALCKSKEGIDG